MNSDRDIKALLSAIMNEDVADENLADDEPEEVLSPFALKLREALRAAIDQMRLDEVLEVEDESVDALVAEVTEAGLDSNSPKQLMKKIIQALLDSERVEEVYATDEALKSTLRRFLGAE